MLWPLGEDGAFVEIPEADRKAVTANWYDDELWPRPGTYHVEVSVANSNFVGTVTNAFVIEKNPAYFFTDPDKGGAKTTQAAAVAAAVARNCRILYFGSEDLADAASAYMVDRMTDDFEFNEWIKANFVCWTDSAASADFLKYAQGLDEAACPLVCILNPKDLAEPILSVSGYQTVEDLKALLDEALFARVAASAVDVSFRPGRDVLVYDGTVRQPTADDLRLVYAETELEPTAYDVVAEKSVDVGEYRVHAVMKPSVTVGEYAITGETASVAYRIAPCEVYDGMPSDVRAKLGIGLQPKAAAYSGAVQRPAVTSAVAHAFVDYGTNDWYNIGTHTLDVHFDGNYRGKVSETFAITAQVVKATVELDRYEEFVSGKSTGELKPNVLRVYDATRTYVENADYTVDYGSGDYAKPGTNTVRIVFCGNYAGEVNVKFVLTAVEELVDGPTVEGDPGAEVTGDAEKGYVIVPSKGRETVEVVIPTGVDAGNVTVKVEATVRVVKPKGASVRIARGAYSYDISENLTDVQTNADESINLESARVRDDVVREIFTKEGARFNLSNPAEPELTAVTREGLLYTFREGATLEAMRADEATEANKKVHTGDGKAWPLPVSITGGASGFYGVEVSK